MKDQQLKNDLHLGIVLLFLLSVRYHQMVLGCSLEHEYNLFFRHLDKWDLWSFSCCSSLPLQCLF